MCGTGSSATRPTQRLPHQQQRQRQPQQRQHTNNCIQNQEAMATPRVASPVYSPFLNAPNDPPVVFQAIQSTAYNHQMEEEEERCRACSSTALIVDWRQGDRVCTNCGVVADERLRDDRAEWKDFNEVEDMVKGKQNGARCGMVPVDETKYLGGLQPTMISNQAYGPSTSGGYDAATIRNRLVSTNRKLDHMMEQVHAKSLSDANLIERLKRKRAAKLERQNEVAAKRARRPEFDKLLLQEEKSAQRAPIVMLHGDKWSLARAIKLYGESHDHVEHASEENGDSNHMGDREQMLASMDKNLKKASQDLYIAYSMITNGARQLNLPARVINETTGRLVRFVTRKDGFSVPGISSRLSKSQGATDPTIRKRATETLRMCNQRRQIAALCGTLLFLTARSMGWARSFKDIVANFQPIYDDDNSTNSNNNNAAGTPSIPLPPQILSLKLKHCNKAITEIRSVFPEYTRNTQPLSSDTTGQGDASGPNEIDTLANLASHAAQKLQLSPVAEATIQTLLAHCRKEQIETGKHSGTNLPVLCASVTYFVATAGAVMQRLARQSEKGGASSSKSASSTSPQHASNDDNDSDDSTDNESSNDEEIPFDVFTCPAILETSSDTMEYELKRMWDTWMQQMPWSRTPAEIEQSCGATRTSFLEVYKSQLYPRRATLLQVLRDAVSNDQTNTDSKHSDTNFLTNSAMAKILLNRMDFAGPLKW